MTRREFLALTSAFALGAQGRAGMFISLNGSVTRGLNSTERARLAARLGYGGVDWDLGPAKTAGLDATKALFAELKIKPASVGFPMPSPFPFGGEDADFNARLKGFAADIAFVSAVGCRAMMVVLPPATGALTKADLRSLAVKRLAAISEVLHGSNVRLGIEFLGPLYFRQRKTSPVSEPFIWNLPDAVALAKDAGPNIGVTLDAWHWHHSRSTVQNILDAGASRLVQVHVSDARTEAVEDVRDDHRLMPGEGTIDLIGFFHALQRAGYTGAVSPEPLGRIPADMPPETAATLALDTTTAVMKKAGVM